MYSHMSSGSELVEICFLVERHFPPTLGLMHDSLGDLITMVEGHTFRLVEDEKFLRKKIPSA